MHTSLTKKLGLSVAALAMVATSLFTASDAEAVPAFARQTGMSCNSCHFQTYPSLNGMGRSFKAGNFAMKGAQTAIEGENIDLPSSLNVSAIWKSYYISSDDAVGEIAYSDEIALLVGGRAAAGVGFLWELGQAGQDAEVEGHADVDDTSDTFGEVTAEGGTNGNFLSSKIGFTAVQSGSTSFSVIPYTTDALGSAYGFELMNTAAVRNGRAIEKRDAMSASSDFHIGNGEATGIALVAADLATGWWVNVALWAPVADGGHADLTGLANSVRVGYFFDLAGFDTGVAYMMRSGEVKTTDGTTDDKGNNVQNVNAKVAGTLLDFQMQGQVGGNDLGLYVSYAAAADSHDLDEYTFDSTTGDLTGATVHADGYVEGGGSGLGLTVKYSVTPKIHVHYATNSWAHAAAYTAAESNSGDAITTDAYTRASVGVDYKVSENIALQAFQYTSADMGGDSHSKMYLGWFMGL